jgi:hypothetical protein
MIYVFAEAVKNIKNVAVRPDNELCVKHFQLLEILLLRCHLKSMQIIINA